MTRPSSFLLRAGLAIAIGLGVAAATSAQPARGLDARLDRLAAELDLTAQQRAEIAALAGRYADADRAALWSAAADLSDVLTDEQVDALRQRVQARHEQVEARRGERPDRFERGRRGRQSARGMHGRRDGRRGGDARAALTDEQREALREVRNDVREQTEALVTDLRAGDVSEAEFADRLRQIRETGRAQAAEALPAEAAARLAEREARRGAETAARAEALGLTAEQEAAFEPLAAARVRQASERPDLRPYLDAEGRLDREALRDALITRAEAR